MRFRPMWCMAVLTVVSCAHLGQANSYLSNYNEPNTQKLIQAMQQKQLHMVQFGDSHTAADHFTHAVRTRLQATLGDGGMGWAMPMYFAGQRMSLFGYDNTGWQPISSRAQHEGHYTLGGLNAVPQYAGAKLTLKPKLNTAQAQQIRVSIRQGAQAGAFIGIDAEGRSIRFEAAVKNNTWQLVEFTARLPFTITASDANSVIGGWWAKSTHAQGAVVSAIGINGAELSHLNRWSAAWTQELEQIAPQLVVLAYGTNEAYNGRVDYAKMVDILTEKVRQIRRASPNAAIMIVSAPESLKSTAGGCGTRPASLSQIQSAQQQVAQNQNTLFWNWQQAMGGNCSMKNWIAQGKALSDGVHFSVAGYQQLGQQFSQDLLGLAKIPMSQAASTSASYQPATSFKPTPSLSLGYAKICLEGASECASIGAVQ